MTNIISGENVLLRAASMADRRSIYEWLVNSDLTRQMMGLPYFPDNPIPTWDDFLCDYKPYFFDGSKPLWGRCFLIESNSEAVGQINHDKIINHTTELDIWLRSSKFTKMGYGVDAINLLCEHLERNYGCRKFIMAPSGRNKFAIRAYEKAGFKISNEKPEGFVADYIDAVVMIRNF